MKEIKIGDFIKDARLASGYNTKKEFSLVTGVSPATLTRIENNTQTPTPDTLLKLSKHLKSVTYGELMKVANYFDGLKEEHEVYLVDFMNENEELDELIDLYRRNDYDIDSKKNIVEELNKIIMGYSPKLKEYFKHCKKVKPIPLVGSICAGNGLIAKEEIEEFINFPFLNDQQIDYALKVKGDSMKNAGIEDGDIVFLRKASWAEFNGQIVAVIINGEEGSLKRISWSEGTPRFTLSPENEAYQSVEVSPNELIICGVYAGHFRPFL
ncbi:helix-turn-helix domain-containing protein [Paenibacillus alvei]|uniref:helix-turn-helix domain-containing protein n=1 Tax=Paenibacillus alvei TaxID=44250 RepID=UPI002283AB8F|nr:S24 family peptidase [Paenibacillus alvei]MCY9708658.1 helix-turn-helix domain-containing protein [Paenibacillus alvei]